MRNLSLIGIGLAALVFTGAAYAYTHVFWLSIIKYSDFNDVGKKIYIDPILDKKEHEKILDLLSQSKERIVEKYGSFSAMPTIVITGTTKNSKKYGLGAFPGKAFSAPWEGYIVINNQTIDINLLAHELMHAQMRYVLGYWAYQTKIPTWFDEGVAMQVDYRDPYKVDYRLFDRQEIERVKTLDSPAKFWTATREQDIENYRAAKAAVQEVWSIYSPKTLYSMLLRVRQGEEFRNVFSASSTKGTS